MELYSFIAFLASHRKDIMSKLSELYNEKKCRSCVSQSTNGMDPEGTLPLEQEPSSSRTTHCLRRYIAVSCVAVAPIGKLSTHWIRAKA